MPIFNYRCPKCGATFELLLRTADEKAECPECCNPKLEKLPTSFSSKISRSGCAAAGRCPSAAAHCCDGHCGCHQ